MIDRRGFFKRFLAGGTAAALALGEVDLDALVWTPGQKTIFIPEAVRPRNHTITLASESDLAALTKGKTLAEAMTLGDVTVITGLGACLFDPMMNLLSINGRPISGAEEHARCEASLYQRGGTIRISEARYRVLIAEKAAKRAMAGIKDDDNQMRSRQMKGLSLTSDWYRFFPS